jgi:hypothetical protein
MAGIQTIVSKYSELVERQSCCAGDDKTKPKMGSTPDGETLWPRPPVARLALSAYGWGRPTRLIGRSHVVEQDDKDVGGVGRRLDLEPWWDRAVPNIEDSAMRVLGLWIGSTVRSPWLARPPGRK